MVKLTPKQYAALQNAQAQASSAQANLRQVMELLGLETEKPYAINPDKATIVVEEVKVDNQPIVR